MDANTANPYVLAAWCHYAFGNIHPFMVNLAFQNPSCFFGCLWFHRMVTGVYHGFLLPLFCQERNCSRYSFESKIKSDTSKPCRRQTAVTCLTWLLLSHACRVRIGC